MRQQHAKLLLFISHGLTFLFIKNIVINGVEALIIIIWILTVKPQNYMNALSFPEPTICSVNGEIARRNLKKAA